MIREGFLEEDAFEQGGAGNGERRGQSRAEGTTGWPLPEGGGVDVRDQDGGAWPGRRGNWKGGSFSIEGDFLLCCEGGGGKTAKSFGFCPDTVMSRGQDRAAAFLGCLPSPRPAASATGVCPSPAWRLEIQDQSRADPPQAALLGMQTAISSPRPHRVTPLCLCPDLLFLQGPPVLWDEGPA